MGGSLQRRCGVLMFMHRLMSLRVINQHLKVSLKWFRNTLSTGKRTLLKNVVKIKITITPVHSVWETGSWVPSPSQPGWEVSV